MKTYAIANSKGGCGKTSTAAAMMDGLTRRGFRVLGVDLDSQRDLTIATAGNADMPGSLHVMEGKLPAAGAVQHTKQGDLISAERSLSGIDSVLTGSGREYRLKEALDPLQSEYDFCILDLQPILSVGVINALTAADSLIIPTTPDRFSVEGIVQLNETIVPVRKYSNKALQVEGILIVRYKARTTISRDTKELLNQIAEAMHTKVFTTAIRDSVYVSDAQQRQQSTFEYKPRSKVAADYRSFLDELIGEEKKP